jgi:NCAIR mutase (PurE)-related proteins
MTNDMLQDLLSAVKNGGLSVAEGMNALRDSAFLDLGHTKFDTHRALRNGFPEVVYAEGKTPEQVAEIFCLPGTQGNILATRVSPEMASHVQSLCPDAEYNQLGRTLTLARSPQVWKQGEVVIVTAGTSDLPVAEEAHVTCGMLGCKTRIISDVGVAGIHRLLTCLPAIRSARVVIVVAGMEGALASVVGGLIPQPVIAVPTSVGYGASFAGLSALLGMLTSCASGVTVVNIDNGFGAACAACRIANA